MSTESVGPVSKQILALRRVLVNDVDQFCEQKKRLGIRPYTGVSKDAPIVSHGKLGFYNLFGGLSIVWEADLRFIATCA